MSIWQDFESQLKNISRCGNRSSETQLRHRMALADIWAPKPGDRILEVGCGQGDTTVVLAAAVGENGKVVATDIADDE